MATVRRFEELEAWRRSRELAREIYSVSKKGPFARDFGLRDQVRRAAVSIMSNLAEGFERGGDREFIHFAAQAKGSSAEVRAQLYVALDQGYIDQQTFDRLTATTIEINQMLAGLIKYLRSSNLKGSKYKGN